MSRSWGETSLTTTSPIEIDPSVDVLEARRSAAARSSCRSPTARAARGTRRPARSERGCRRPARRRTTSTPRRIAPAPRAPLRARTLASRTLGSTGRARRRAEEDRCPTSSWWVWMDRRNAWHALEWAVAEATLRGATLRIVCAFEDPVTGVGLGTAFGAGAPITVDPVAHRGRREGRRRRGGPARRQRPDRGRRALRPTRRRARARRRRAPRCSSSARAATARSAACCSARSATTSSTTRPAPS